MSDRTFKLGKTLMEGDDVKDWQQTLIKEFKHLKIENVPLAIDGIYGPTTRSISAVFFKAAGLSPNLVKQGITPGIRTKIATRRFTEIEEKKRHSSELRMYRAQLRNRWAETRVHTPATKILADTWGYHPGVHDGLDLIVPPDVPIFAMVKARVIDVRAGGWWGKSPSGKVSLGDGIIQLEVLEDVGPFKKGMHIGYGHAEKAKVKVGQTVKPGQVIGHAGFAVAWHIHLMVNTGNTSKGIGNLNPEKFYRYAVENG